MPVPPPLLNGRVRELTLGALFESNPVAQAPGLRHLLGLPLPPWQRPEVWTVTQKQKFIEGLFLGFASGQYVVNGQDWDSQTADPLPCSGWLLDGQQRISALRDFVQGDLVVFGDVTYGSLSKAEQLRLMRKPFPCFELHYTANEDTLRDLYDRLNFGGTAHTEDQRASHR